jgi:MFS family permease
MAARRRFYYGWVMVGVAALMMLATLPGRTQGLGLITEPLLTDLGLSRAGYARINLWATLLGSALCLPAGRWFDRYGARKVLAALLAGLGMAVLSMSAATGVGALFVLITVARGLGQSALSVASIALVGRWFRRRISLAMGVYSVLVGLMFASAFGFVGLAVREQGWRMAWGAVALALLGACLPLAWLLVRDAPERCGAAPAASGAPGGELEGMALAAALRTPAFWVFALATSVYGLAVSGIGLFNESILRELGFDAKTYHMTLVVTALVGLIAQFVGGWLGGRWGLRRLTALAMALYAVSLFWLPHVADRGQLYGNATLMGAAGGMMTVVFFAVWPQLFGRRHLGVIQGAAQTLTVLSSAAGPLLFAECFARTGSYSPVFYALAPIVMGLGAAAWNLPTTAARIFAPDGVSG